MYTLDWVSVFKASWGWLIETDANWKNRMFLLLQFAGALFAAIVAVNLLFGAIAYLMPPLEYAAGQANVFASNTYYIALAFSVARFAAFIGVLALVSSYFKLKIFQELFNRNSLEFKRRVDQAGAIDYLLFSIKKLIYEILALPSKLRYMAVPCAVIVLLTGAFVLYSLPQWMDGMKLDAAGNPIIPDTGMASGFAEVSAVLIVLGIVLFGIKTYVAARIFVADMFYLSGNDTAASINEVWKQSEKVVLKLFLTLLLVAILNELIVATLTDLGRITLTAVPAYQSIDLVNLVIYSILGSILPAIITPITAIITVYVLFAIYQKIEDANKAEADKKTADAIAP